jgi:D-serine deaminase-like pyridoxal phosphate-dependent protein
VLLAYPLVGPNIDRFIQLQRTFPDVRFWAIGDNLGQLKQLGQKSMANQIKTRVLLDVNPGMNRTGVPMEMALVCYGDAAQIQGIEMAGIHCYDGHRHESNYAVRHGKCQETAQQILKLKRSLKEHNIACTTLVMGGSPSFPCYIEHPEIFLSPGTIFLNDYGYTVHYPDLPFTPAAAILTRVISCPGPNQFTLDLGSKGIAADPVGLRGQIVGLEHAEPLFQSEEPWAWQMVEGHEAACPEVGDSFFVIPTHICPTSALYAEAVVVEKGQQTGTWPITARNRRLTF